MATMRNVAISILRLAGAISIAGGLALSCLSDQSPGPDDYGPLTT
jgi:hypothetical protein